MFKKKKRNKQKKTRAFILHYLQKFALIFNLKQIINLSTRAKIIKFLEENKRVFVSWG